MKIFPIKLDEILMIHQITRLRKKNYYSYMNNAKLWEKYQYA